MRILIVGASGQIGGHLRARLSEQGHTVAGTYKTVSRPGLFPLDLEDKAALSAALFDVRPDVVILPAGWTWVDGNEQDPARAQRENCDAPLELFRQVHEHGALFVTYSSDYIFDGNTGDYAEDAPTGPLNAYGHAKLACEEGIRAIGPRHLILRTSTVYGPEHQGKNFVYQLVRRLRAGQPFVVPSDQVASPSYGPDVADATIALIDGGKTGTWHVAGPDALDRGAFAQLACEVFDLDPSGFETKISAEYQTTRRPLQAALNTGKLRAEGIVMKSARDGLEAMAKAIEAGGWARL
jgi:dTDP-4-dehydrorhamnose reductase